MMTPAEKQAAFLALQQGFARFNGRSLRLLNAAEALDTDELRVMLEALSRLAGRLREEVSQDFRLEACTLAEQLDQHRNEGRRWLPKAFEFDELHRRLEKLAQLAEYVNTRGKSELGRCRRYVLEHLICARSEAHLATQQKEES